MMQKTITKSRKSLNVLLWTAQILLAAGFFWAAFMKLCQSAETLAEMWPWTASHPSLVRTTGIIDLLAGMGLVFPGLLRMTGKWTVAAALGTVCLMIAAIVFHVSRGEASQIGINLFFMVLAMFVAWGRWNDGKNA